MQSTTAASTNRVFRALLARFLCLLHITLSGFVLFHVKQSPGSLAYLVPTLGAFALVGESAWMVVIRRGRPAFASFFSTCFAIYVPTIVASYWMLELDNLPKFSRASSSPTITIRSYRLLKPDLMSPWSARLMWTRVELQLFLAIIILIRWLALKSTNNQPSSFSPQLLKYFGIACDMLDFLAITQDPVLGLNAQLVYWTLAAWSWSTIQFFVRIPSLTSSTSSSAQFRTKTISNSDLRAYFSNSLLSVFFLDLPYFGIRIAAIFAFGSHSLNSYFFAAKNLVLIVYQLYKIKDTFLERDEQQQHQKDADESSANADVGRERAVAFLSQLRLNKDTEPGAGDMSIQHSLEGLLTDEATAANHPHTEESLTGDENKLRPTAISLEQIIDEQLKKAVAIKHQLNEMGKPNSMNSIYCEDQAGAITNWTGRLVTHPQFGCNLLPPLPPLPRLPQPSNLPFLFKKFTEV